MAGLQLAFSAAWQLLRSGALLRGMREWRRTLRKARWFSLRYRGIDEIVLPFQGMKLTVSTADHAIGCHVFVDGEFGLTEFRRAMSILARDTLFSGSPPVFVDVGANIGTHTLYALKTGLFGRVISIEPEPGNFRLLQENLRANGYPTHDAYNVALSNSVGTGQLALSEHNLGDHRIVRSPSGSSLVPETRATTRIELVDFATLATNIALDPASRLVFWIDTQGHEFEVLAGIPEDRLRASPFVIEFWPTQLQRNGTLEALHALLARVVRRLVVLQEGERFRSPGELDELVQRFLNSSDETSHADLLCLGFSS